MDLHNHLIENVSCGNCGECGPLLGNYPKLFGAIAYILGTAETISIA